MILFQKNDPWHFGTLHDALLTLFRVATGEDWTDVMYINMFGCYEYGYLANGMTPSCNAADSGGLDFLATFYFLVFIVIGALVMLTLFIGVVTTSMDESTQEQAEAKEQDEKVVKIAAQQDIDGPTLQIYKNVFGYVAAACVHVHSHSLATVLLVLSLSSIARSLLSLSLIPLSLLLYTYL